eukprot:7772405-Pyramimonas_sp.AAC.1
MDVMQRKRDDAKQRAAMKRPAAATPPIASGGDADEAYVEDGDGAPAKTTPPMKRAKPANNSPEQHSAKGEPRVALKAGKATQTLAKISVEDFVGWSSSDKGRTKNAFASAACGKAKTRAL